MHDNVFDRFHSGDSLLHRLDPRVKVVVTVIFIISNVLLPDAAWLAFSLSWLLLLGANRLSRLGIWFSFKRSFVALPFALAAVTAIFSIPGNALWHWQIGLLTLTATDAGVLRFLSILVRSWLSVQMAILLVAVTPFPDLIHAFEHLRVPAILTTIVAFLYRYLFVLTDEVMRLMRARESRSATLPGHKSGGNVFWRTRVVGNMTGQLFLRSFERSDRIYNAMLARGYQGQIRTLHAHTMHRSDWLYGLAAVVLILSLHVVGHFPLG